MDVAEAQREIDALLETLKKAKSIAGLGPDDPSVVALEQIIMTKVSALEALKAAKADRSETADADKADCGPAEVFFAPVEDGNAESVLNPNTRRAK